MSSVAELRQILKEDSSGRDLYGHLVETLMKILVDRPANAYDAFELISAEVKDNPFDPSPTRGKPLPPAPQELNAMNKWTSRNATMLKVRTGENELANKYNILIILIDRFLTSR